MKVNQILGAIALLALACSQSMMTIAQTKIVVHFNEQGQLAGELPERININDKLSVEMIRSDNPQDAYLKSLKTKAAAAKNRANSIKTDPKFNDIKILLNDLYQISDADLTKIYNDCNSIEANQTIAPANHLVPFLSGADDYYNIVVKNKPLTSTNFGYQGTSADFVATATDGKSMQLTLTLTDKYKKGIYDWLMTNKSDFHEIPASKLTEWNELKTKEQALIKDIKAFVAQPPPGEDLASINKAAGDAAALHAKAVILIGQIKLSVNQSLNKNWLMKWFWYEDSHIPLLNPFKFTASSSLGAKPDTSDNIALRAKVQARLDYLKTAKDLKASDADKIIDEMARFRREINTNAARMDNYNKAIAANQKALDDFGQTKSYLNTTTFYLTDKTAKPPYEVWMRHYNAADFDASMTLNQRKEYLEDEQVVTIEHNIAVNQQVSIEYTYTPIANSQSLIADEITGAIKMIGALPKLNIAGGSSSRLAQSINSEKGNYNRSIRKDLPQDLDDLAKYDGYIDYLVKQTNPETDVKENPAQTYTYHSQPKFGDEQSGDQQANIAIKTVTPTGNTTTAPAASGGTANASVTASAPASSATTTTSTNKKIRINKRYRIYPMSGFAYTTDQFSYVGTNADGTAPGKVTQEPAMHLIAGLKFYIHKTDIRSSKFIAENDEDGNPLFWSRAHIDVAVAVSDPMRNIFVGGGVDLWPGFSVNTGMVFNRYTYNSFAIGTSSQSRTLYRPGFYVGITTDLSVITEIVKLLSTGK